MTDRLSSRRNFLKIAGLGLSAAILRPDRIVKADEILKTVPFSVDVYSWGGKAFYPRLINFDNSIDFPPEPVYKQPQLDSQQIAYNFSQSSKEAQRRFSSKANSNSEPNPIWVTPQFAVSVDGKSEQREFNNLVLDAATVPAYAMIASALFAGSAKKGSKEMAFAGGAVLTTGLIKAVVSAMTRPLNPQDPNYYERFAGVPGQYYPIFPQFSSMRSQIIMDDIWHNLPAGYHKEPVQALSFSNTDGLENFSKKDAKSLKDQIIRDNKFDGTIIQSAVQAGSLEAVFNYTIEDLTTGQVIEQKLSDWKFLSDLNRKLGNEIPQKPLPGSQKT